MTIEKFYETLENVIKLDSEYSLQSGLQGITDALINLVNSPAQPPYQAALASAIAAFTQGISKLEHELTPALSDAIAQIGGSEFFNSQLAGRVQASISANAMTPSVARDFVQKLSKERSDFLQRVTETRNGMKELGVENTALKAGTADIAFLIPRELFDNKLGSFAKELVFLNRLMKVLSEAITGTSQDVELETLSTSIPTVALIATLPVAEAIGRIVNLFLDAWTKVEKIRHIRAELEEIGIKKAALGELTEQITETVNSVVEESTVLLLKDYRGEAGRRNELANGVRAETKRLFAQIERGLQVQLRAEPDEDATAEDRSAFQALDTLGKSLQYPSVTGKPMLLSDGLIIEGDIVVRQVTKRTETKRTGKKAVEAAP